ncbi:hypothetical protein GCK32_019513, partial [Trichostrongylus colubriformis]
ARNWHSRTSSSSTAIEIKKEASSGKER